MKVLGIGEAVLDITSVVTRMSNDGVRRVKDTRHDAGGPVLSALILLAGLGMECHMVTSLGKDEAGDRIRSLLKSRGISLAGNVRPQTKRHTIVVDDRTGQRQKYRGAIEHAPVQAVSKQLIQSADLIILDRHEPMAFYEVVRYKRPEALLLVDPSTELSPFTMDMMRHASHPVVPIETLAQVHPTAPLSESLRILHDICTKPFIVTAGELGSIIYDGQECAPVEPYAVKAIDANGAGDVYRGALAYGLLQGWTLGGCAAYANAAAALQCTRLGNASAVPTAAEIKATYSRPPDNPATIQQIEQRLQELRRNHVTAENNHRRAVRRGVQRTDRHRHSRSQKTTSNLPAHQPVEAAH